MVTVRHIAIAGLLLGVFQGTARADSFEAVRLSRLKAMTASEKADFAARATDAVVQLDTVDLANEKLKATDVEEAANLAATGWGASVPVRIWVSLPLDGLNRASWDVGLDGLTRAGNNSLIHGLLFHGYTTALGPYEARKIVETLKGQRPGLVVGEYAPVPAVGYYFWQAFFAAAQSYGEGSAALLVGQEVKPEEYGVQARVVEPERAEP